MGPVIYQVDAFTSTPFAGNQAAVCLLGDERAEEWMQSLAAEMNLSETAFVKSRDGQGEFSLRWFTPTMEVDLCGHATLAAAHVLWQAGRVAADRTIRFHTRSGVLSAARRQELIELDFPADPVDEVSQPVGLAGALGLKPLYVGKGRDDYLVVFETERQVRELAPDFRQLANIPARGFIVTAPGEGEFDFVSRFFAPRAGIDEDPATGSAHCTLAGYWQSRLDRQAFTAYQASQRGGMLKVAVNGTRITLGGQAVTIFKGNLYD